jgi:chromosome segregation ATPase
VEAVELTARNRILSLEAELAGAASQLNASQARIAEVEAVELTARNRILSLEAELAGAASQLNASQARIAEVEAVELTARNRILSLEAELAGAASQLNASQARIAEVEATGQIARERIHTLETELARAGWKQKAYIAQEEITFQRFYELNAKLNHLTTTLAESERAVLAQSTLVGDLREALNAQAGMIDERDALIKVYEAIVSEHRRLNPVVGRVRRAWSLVPRPFRSAVLRSGRALLRAGRFFSRRK